MGRKCLTEITPKQLQFSPTLTGKHNLIGKIPVHNVFSVFGTKSCSCYYTMVHTKDPNQSYEINSMK